jgi:uncharacterized protein YbjT (DUF2867 family)
MTNLVTGVSGRVGSRVVPRLLAEEEHTRVLVRDAGAVESLRARGAEVVEGDLAIPTRCAVLSAASTGSCTWRWPSAGLPRRSW